MINHIVLFQFKANIAESDICSAVTQFADLKKTIPGIKSFSFGKNCSPEQLNKGFTHAFIMTFDNENSRRIYLEHPEHQRIARDVIIPMLENALESAIVVDFAEP